LVLQREESESEIRRRGGRTGRSVQDYLDRDSRPVPEVLRRQSHDDSLGLGDIDRTQYFSPQFHELEMERMWSRVWQMACHQDEIPNIGDATVYDIGDWSIIVVRVGSAEFKAFYNTCPHRGTRLCSEPGTYREFRCPYHAWTWTIDGKLKNIPCRWDFPQLDGDEVPLPEVHVDTWGGFVFVNFDPNAAPFSEYLGALPEHYDRWPLEDRPGSMWVGKEVACNWKGGIGAFVEGWHVVGVHPQLISFNGDGDGQYDTWPGQPNISRYIFPAAVPGTHLNYDISEQDVADEFAQCAAYFDVSLGDSWHVPEGELARTVVAARMRDMLGPAALDLDALTDSEVLDGIQYYLFPNFVPYGGVGTSLAYRFRPLGHDPNRCLFEVYVLGLQARPEPGAATRLEMRFLSDGEHFCDVKEFGVLGEVLDQDVHTLELSQLGVRSRTSRPGLKFSKYQESRLRHLHRTLDSYLGS
jgi:phenylpropionate dioxygenase-like ring-hydroxylating dioxygenase large terminal subunit